MVEIVRVTILLREVEKFQNSNKENQVKIEDIFNFLIFVNIVNIKYLIY